MKAASDIAQFDMDNCQAVRQIIETEKIACDYMEIMSSSVFLDESQAQKGKKFLEDLVAQGHDMMQRFQYHEGQAAEDASGVNGARGLVTFQAACLW